MQRNICRHVVGIENEYFEKDVFVEGAVEEMVIMRVIMRVEGDLMDNVNICRHTVKIYRYYMYQPMM